MPAQQLALDVLVAARAVGTRHTLALAEHQRGWISLPRPLADFTPTGTVIPAWVCCICGGVEINSYKVERNHGCCDPHTVNMPCERRDRWPASALEFDAAWTPDHPGRRP
ncbi:hypothetical protein [Micromonospora tarensis]|uniref:Uncharacterized protein n=1 Tax=Micromonospora tarensis TaxID=2806100 RepID=A0ABS1YCN1_9ACTN|nr:hypothetical protein [Micromonospora tarensis]MBM0275115.1 hypothetical protein [Micromonospora tarensis]